MLILRKKSSLSRKGQIFFSGFFAVWGGGNNTKKYIGVSTTMHGLAFFI